MRSSAAQGAPGDGPHPRQVDRRGACGPRATRPRGVARDLERLLESAVANAENNHELVGDDLVVKEVYADEGPTLKRYRPRAQGRATRIRKRTSHMTVELYHRRSSEHMGQKVHPEGFRVGYIHDWKSNWFNEREFADYLLEDIQIREHIENKLGHAGLSDIRIRKNKNEVTVDIHTARPGIVIGKSGARGRRAAPRAAQA